MGGTQKSFTQYVDSAPSWWESRLQDYQERPAVAFLKESVHISDSINQCRRRFARKKNGDLNKDGQDSMYRLGAAAMSSMMSHFETYQRALFSGMLEASRFIGTFRLDDCCKRLEKDSHIVLDLPRLFAYRGRTAPIGLLVADSLGSWHNPARVNAHFSALVPDMQFLSGKESEQLAVLWQLRHSIVHTGGWLTHADAQKVPLLSELADAPILFNETFVEGVTRKLHGLVNRSTTRLGTRFVTKMTSANAAERKAVAALFEVKSPRPGWLHTAV